MDGNDSARKPGLKRSQLQLLLRRRKSDGAHDSIGRGVSRRERRIIAPRAPAIGNFHCRTAAPPIFRANGKDQIPLPE